MVEQALYGALAPFYDRIYDSKDYRTEARRLQAIARRALRGPIRSVLDVGCGTGVHLAQFDPRVDRAGVDRSAAMLREARRRLGPRVPLRRDDMRRFDLGRTFDVVTCLFSAIGYMQTRADRDRALARFYAHVRPGGVALVEGWVLPERWRDRSIHVQRYEGPEATIVRLTSATRQGSRSTLDMHYLIGRPGRRVVHLAELHHNPLVSAEDMLGSFRRAGFRARILRSGSYRDRGLYVGVRPRDRP